MDRLREIHVEHCDHLTFLEKFAFKGMKKLRLISFTNCPRLNEIPKASFSGIGNDFGVKIQFHRTPVQRVHSGAFRHAHNIRELTISGSDLALSRHAFAAITQLDFLTITGVTVIEPQLFTNSTRFYIVHLKELNCEIPPRAFEDLSHVHQNRRKKEEKINCNLSFRSRTWDREAKVLIQRSRISTISTDAFTGMSTVETVELFDNQIGVIAARAFASIVNLGRVRIARNHIETLQTVESLLSTAIHTRVEENTLECGCDLQWMTAHEDRRIADVNYCGPSGVHRTVRTYLRQYCHRPKPTELSTSSETFVVTNHDRMLGEPQPPSTAARYRLGSLGWLVLSPARSVSSPSIAPTPILKNCNIYRQRPTTAAATNSPGAAMRFGELYWELVIRVPEKEARLGHRRRGCTITSSEQKKVKTFPNRPTGNDHIVRITGYWYRFIDWSRSDDGMETVETQLTAVWRNAIDNIVLKPNELSYFVTPKK
ncbi:leucine Rich repeat-containing domain protein [Teladorsagia circumcincta]|uniref:Leucine Rich repeat-containing domain protein n=1 Tax=Teladorsagia circumcincta TaxID=45464 RepID=A0A2G9U8Q8_TELCI|nr:leucine Rich repeat-containing domain protein [Teladorsagia circumcincta]